MNTESEPAEIGLLLYPGVQLAAVLGLTDLFGVASRFAVAQRSCSVTALRVTHWQKAAESAEVGRVYDTHPNLPGRPLMLILPPSLGDPISREAAAPLAHWLRDRHAAGTTVCSVCLGAFLLAET